MDITSTTRSDLFVIADQMAHMQASAILGCKLFTLRDLAGAQDHICALLSVWMGLRGVGIPSDNNLHVEGWVVQETSPRKWKLVEKFYLEHPVGLPAKVEDKTIILGNYSYAFF